MNLTPQQIINRFCDLREQVTAHFGYSHAADCICGRGGSHAPGTTAAQILASTPPEFWRDDGAVMEFIESAVRAAIKGTPVQPNLIGELENLRDSVTSVLNKVAAP